MPEKKTSQASGMLLTRRGFLATAGQGALTLSLLSSGGIAGCLLRTRTNPVVPSASLAQAKTFNSVEWEILSAVQSHLLPDEVGAPGAAEAQTIGYVDAVLQSPDVDPLHAGLVKDGLTHLDAESRKLFAKPFVELGEAERENLLRQFEETESGDEWLMLVLTYTLEAYLGDPVYGGNPDGIVWKYLEHNPGVPRPTKAFGLDLVPSTANSRPSSGQSRQS
jgi:gluconate 2-dehydrogenase gamma chain